MKSYLAVFILVGLIALALHNPIFDKQQSDASWLNPKLESISHEFQDGDLLFVNNQSIWSDIASRFSQTDKRFGHVGVFFRDSKGQSKVIHAYGDPLDTAGKVRVEALDLFAASTQNLGWFGWAVDDQVRQDIVAQSLHYVQAGYVFNQGFELGKEGQLYCTELIWRAFLETQGIDLVPEKRTAFNRPFIGLDDLTDHALIYERGYWIESP